MNFQHRTYMNQIKNQPGDLFQDLFSRIENLEKNQLLQNQQIRKYSQKVQNLKRQIKNQKKTYRKTLNGASLAIQKLKKLNYFCNLKASEFDTLQNILQNEMKEFQKKSYEQLTLVNQNNKKGISVQQVNNLYKYDKSIINQGGNAFHLGMQQYDEKDNAIFKQINFSDTLNKYTNFQPQYMYSCLIKVMKMRGNMYVGIEFSKDSKIIVNQFGKLILKRQKNTLQMDGNHSMLNNTLAYTQKQQQNKMQMSSSKQQKENDYAQYADFEDQDGTLNTDQNNQKTLDNIQQQKQNSYQSASMLKSKQSIGLKTQEQYGQEEEDDEDELMSIAQFNSTRFQGARIKGVLNQIRQTKFKFDSNDNIRIILYPWKQLIIINETKNINITQDLSQQMSKNNIYFSFIVGIDTENDGVRVWKKNPEQQQDTTQQMFTSISKQQNTEYTEESQENEQELTLEQQIQLKLDQRQLEKQQENQYNY